MKSQIAFKFVSAGLATAIALAGWGLIFPSGAFAAEKTAAVHCKVGMNITLSEVESRSLDACIQSLRASGQVTGLEVVGLAPSGLSRVSKFRISEEHATLVAAKLSLEFPDAIVNASGGAGRVATTDRAVLVTGYTSRSVTSSVPSPKEAAGTERIVTYSRPDTSGVRFDTAMDDGLYEGEVALGRVAYSREPEIASERHPSFTSTANVGDVSF